MRATFILWALRAVAGMGLCVAMGTASAQSCQWFQQIKFADGAVGCTTDYAFLKDASISTTGRSVIAEIGSQQHNAVAASDNPQLCPAVSVVAGPGGASPMAFIVRAGASSSQQLAAMIADVCAARARSLNPSCSCVPIFLDGISQLSKKQFDLIYGSPAQQVAALGAGGSVAAAQPSAPMSVGSAAPTPAPLAATAQPAVAAPPVSLSAGAAAATPVAVASTPAVSPPPAPAAAQPDPQAERMMVELAAARAMLEQMRKQQEELLKTTQTAMSQAAQQAAATQAAMQAAQAQAAQQTEDARRAQAQAQQQTAAAQAALQAAQAARTQVAAAPVVAARPEPVVPRMTARALIIGNSGYTHFGALPNPRRDATAMAERLRGLGIEADVVIDADRDSLIKALNDFEAKARRVDVNILFYAGHGVQVEGVNYMVPVNMRADGVTAGYIRLAAIPLGAILDYMPAKTRLVFLDACRDNPAARSLVATRSASSVGLAPVQTVSGTLISYATRDGAVAEDGAGQNSPYTTALLRHLGDPDDIAIVLRRVRTAVMQATGGKQEPWDYGSLTGDAIVLGRMAR